MIVCTPGIWERMPRYVAAWPGIHAMTVTNAMPADKIACQILNHKLEGRCIASSLLQMALQMTV